MKGFFKIICKKSWKKEYLEHQTLGRRFICPIGPATKREFILDWRICDQPHNPPVYLRLIFVILRFEISSLMNWFFFLVRTGFFCLLPVKFKFDIDKNGVHHTWYFELENCKVQIDRGNGLRGVFLHQALSL